MVEYKISTMCTYTDPICPGCECKHRTVIDTCVKYNVYDMCPVKSYGPFLFKFCTRCTNKYMHKNSNLSTGEMMFLTSHKPMTLNTIVHLLETGFVTCSESCLELSSKSESE